MSGFWQFDSTTVSKYFFHQLHAIVSSCSRKFLRNENNMVELLKDTKNFILPRITIKISKHCNAKKLFQLYLMNINHHIEFDNK